MAKFSDILNKMNNPNFQKWFEGSKMVDKSGKPLTVYHGTNKEFDVFEDRGVQAGIHFGSLESATERLAIKEKEYQASPIGGRIIPVNLSIKNPVEIKDGTWNIGDIAGRLNPKYKKLADTLLKKRDEVNWAQLHLETGLPMFSDELYKLKKDLESKIIRDSLAENGYDGFVYKNTFEGKGTTSYMVMKPTQIKSIFNKGTYDINDPRFGYAKGGRVPVDPSISRITPKQRIKNFNRWFKGADPLMKYPDSDYPRTFYHGTSEDFDIFKRTEGGSLGPGNYFTPKLSLSSMYAENRQARGKGYGAHVIQANLNLKKPFIIHNYINQNEKYWVNGKIDSDAVNELIKDGHDGIILMNGRNEVTEVNVFKPEQIKSVFNRGTYDINDPRFGYAKGGVIPLPPMKRAPTERERSLMRDRMYWELGYHDRDVTGKMEYTNQRILSRYGIDQDSLTTFMNIRGKKVDLLNLTLNSDDVSLIKNIKKITSGDYYFDKAAVSKMSPQTIDFVVKNKIQSHETLVKILGENINPWRYPHTTEVKLVKLGYSEQSRQELNDNEKYIRAKHSISPYASIGRYGEIDPEFGPIPKNVYGRGYNRWGRKLENKKVNPTKPVQIYPAPPNIIKPVNIISREDALYDELNKFFQSSTEIQKRNMPKDLYDIGGNMVNITSRFTGNSNEGSYGRANFVPLGSNYQSWVELGSQAAKEAKIGIAAFAAPLHEEFHRMTFLDYTRTSGPGLSSDSVATKKQYLDMISSILPPGLVNSKNNRYYQETSNRLDEFLSGIKSDSESLQRNRYFQGFGKNTDYLVDELGADLFSSSILLGDPAVDFMGSRRNPLDMVGGRGTINKYVMDSLRNAPPDYIKYIKELANYSRKAFGAINRKFKLAGNITQSSLLRSINSLKGYALGGNIPFNPYAERMQMRYGNTKDLRKAGFQLSDGSFIDLSGGYPTRGISHAAAIENVLGQEYVGARTNANIVSSYLRESGAIRVAGFRVEGRKGILDIHINSQITANQIYELENMLLKSGEIDAVKFVVDRGKTLGSDSATVSIGNIPSFLKSLRKDTNTQFDLGNITGYASGGVVRTDQKLMDRFNHVLNKSFSFEKNGKTFNFRYRRTPNAYRAEILDNGKVVSSAYAMYLKNGKADLRRVYTAESYRGSGLAAVAIDNILGDFGKELDFHLTPGPNRSSYINEGNIGEYKNKLVSYYERFGFSRASDKGFGMTRKAGLFGIPGYANGNPNIPFITNARGFYPYPKEIQDLIPKGITGKRGVMASQISPYTLDAIRNIFGFPYMREDDEGLLELFRKLQNLDSNSVIRNGIVKKDSRFSKLASFAFPQMYSVEIEGKHSPMWSFLNDKNLALAIEKATFGGTRQLTMAGLRDKLANINNTQFSGNFRPDIAKNIYDRAPGGRIYDYSMGWGGRMTGFMASKADEYFGVDVNTDNFVKGSGYDKLIQMYLQGNKKVYPIKSPAENFNPSGLRGTFDLAFSSPPYFNKEHYSDDPDQSFLKYGDDVSSWLKGFWGPTMGNIYDLLKPGGSFVTNITSTTVGKNKYDLPQMTRELAPKYGFELTNEIPYDMPRIIPGVSPEVILFFRKLGLRGYAGGGKIIPEDILKRVERQGLTLDIKKAAFLLPNGSYTDNSKGYNLRTDSHGEAAVKYLGMSKNILSDYDGPAAAIGRFLDQTGSVRISNFGRDEGSNSLELALEFGNNNITKSQIESLFISVLQSGAPRIRLVVDSPAFGHKFDSASPEDLYDKLNNLRNIHNTKLQEIPGFFNGGTISGIKGYAGGGIINLSSFLMKNRTKDEYSYNLILNMLGNNTSGKLLKSLDIGTTNKRVSMLDITESFQKILGMPENLPIRYGKYGDIDLNLRMLIDSKNTMGFEANTVMGHSFGLHPGKLTSNIMEESTQGNMLQQLLSLLHEEGHRADLIAGIRQGNLRHSTDSAITGELWDYLLDETSSIHSEQGNIRGKFRPLINSIEKFDERESFEWALYGNRDYSLTNPQELFASEFSNILTFGKTLSSSSILSNTLRNNIKNLPEDYKKYLHNLYKSGRHFTNLDVAHGTITQDTYQLLNTPEKFKKLLGLKGYANGGLILNISNPRNKGLANIKEIFGSVTTISGRTNLLTKLFPNMTGETIRTLFGENLEAFDVSNSFSDQFGMPRSLLDGRLGLTNILDPLGSWIGRTSTGMHGKRDFNGLQSIIALGNQKSGGINAILDTLLHEEGHRSDWISGLLSGNSGYSSDFPYGKTGYLWKNFKESAREGRPQFLRDYAQSFPEINKKRLANDFDYMSFNTNEMYASNFAYMLSYGKPLIPETSKILQSDINKLPKEYRRYLGNLYSSLSKGIRNKGLNSSSNMFDMLGIRGYAGGGSIPTNSKAYIEFFRRLTGKNIDSTSGLDYGQSLGLPGRLLNSKNKMVGLNSNIVNRPEQSWLGGFNETWRKGSQWGEGTRSFDVLINAGNPTHNPMDWINTLLHEEGHRSDYLHNFMTGKDARNSLSGITKIGDPNSISRLIELYTSKLGIKRGSAVGYAQDVYKNYGEIYAGEFANLLTLGSTTNPEISKIMYKQLQILPKEYRQYLFNLSTKGMGSARSLISEFGNDKYNQLAEGFASPNLLSKILGIKGYAGGGIVDMQTANLFDMLFRDSLSLFKQYSPKKIQLFPDFGSRNYLSSAVLSGKRGQLDRYLGYHQVGKTGTNVTSEITLASDIADFTGSRRIDTVLHEEFHRINALGYIMKKGSYPFDYNKETKEWIKKYQEVLAPQLNQFDRAKLERHFNDLFMGTGRENVDYYKKQGELGAEVFSHNMIWGDQISSNLLGSGSVETNQNFIDLLKLFPEDYQKYIRNLTITTRKYTEKYIAQFGKNAGMRPPTETGSSVFNFLPRTDFTPYGTVASDIDELAFGGIKGFASGGILSFINNLFKGNDGTKITQQNAPNLWKKLDLSGYQSGSKLLMQGLNGFQKGGKVYLDRGKTFMVGERGPELITMKDNELVITPNHMLQNVELTGFPAPGVQKSGIGGYWRGGNVTNQSDPIVKKLLGLGYTLEQLEYIPQSAGEMRANISAQKGWYPIPSSPWSESRGYNYPGKSSQTRQDAFGRFSIPPTPPPPPPPLGSSTQYYTPNKQPGFTFLPPPTTPAPNPSESMYELSGKITASQDPLSYLRGAINVSSTNELARRERLKQQFYSMTVGKIGNNIPVSRTEWTKSIPGLNTVSPVPGSTWSGERLIPEYKAPPKAVPPIYDRPLPLYTVGPNGERILTPQKVVTPGIPAENIGIKATQPIYQRLLNLEKYTRTQIFPRKPEPTPEPVTEGVALGRKTKKTKPAKQTERQRDTEDIEDLLQERPVSRRTVGAPKKPVRLNRWGQPVSSAAQNFEPSTSEQYEQIILGNPKIIEQLAKRGPQFATRGEARISQLVKGQGFTETTSKYVDEAGNLQKTIVLTDKYGNAVDNLSKKYKNFGQQIGQNYAEILKWTIGVSLLYAPIQKLSQIYTEMIANQTALAKVVVSLGTAQASQSAIFEEASKIAKETGTDIAGVIQGYNTAVRATGDQPDPTKRKESAATLMKSSITLSKLAGIEQEPAVDIMTAAYKQFGGDVSTTTDMLNKWVTVSRTANVDMATLATSFAIAGESAQGAGLSIDELNGLIAVMAEKSVLSAKETGNAVRALISNYSTDSAGKMLSRFGIAITDITGKTRGFKDIYGELKQAVESGLITPESFNEIARVLGGGSRQGTRAAIVSMGMERMMGIAGVSENAPSNASALAMGTLLDTVDAKTILLNNSFSELAMSLGVEGGLLGVVGALTESSTKTVDELTKLVKVLGSASIYLAAIGVSSLVAPKGTTFDLGRQVIENVTRGPKALAKKLGTVGSEELSYLQYNPETGEGIGPGFFPRMRNPAFKGTVQLSGTEGIGLAGRLGTLSQRDMEGNIVSGMGPLGKVSSGVMKLDDKSGGLISSYGKNVWQGAGMLVASGFLAAMRASSGDSQGAGRILGGAVAGGLLGAAVGMAPIGVAIGTSLAEVMNASIDNKLREIQAAFAASGPSNTKIPGYTPLVIPPVVPTAEGEPLKYIEALGPNYLQKGQNYTKEDWKNVANQSGMRVAALQEEWNKYRSSAEGQRREAAGEFAGMPDISQANPALQALATAPTEVITTPSGIKQQYKVVRQGSFETRIAIGEGGYTGTSPVIGAPNQPSSILPTVPKYILPKLGDQKLIPQTISGGSNTKTTYAPQITAEDYAKLEQDAASAAAAAKLDVSAYGEALRAFVNPERLTQIGQAISTELPTLKTKFERKDLTATQYATKVEQAQTATAAIAQMAYIPTLYGMKDTEAFTKLTQINLEGTQEEISALQSQQASYKEISKQIEEAKITGGYYQAPKDAISRITPAPVKQSDLEGRLKDSGDLIVSALNSTVTDINNRIKLPTTIDLRSSGYTKADVATIVAAAPAYIEKTATEIMKATPGEEGVRQAESWKAQQTLGDNWIQTMEGMDRVTGLTSDAFGDLNQYLIKTGVILKTLSVRTVGVKAEDITNPNSNLNQIYNRVFAQLKEAGVSQPLETMVLYTEDKLVVKTLDRGQQAMDIALAEVNDKLQKQLNGNFNLPSGASFYVPSQAAQMSRKTLDKIGEDMGANTFKEGATRFGIAVDKFAYFSEILIPRTQADFKKADINSTLNNKTQEDFKKADIASKSPGFDFDYGQREARTGAGTVLGSLPLPIDTSNIGSPFKEGTPAWELMNRNNGYKNADFDPSNYNSRTDTKPMGDWIPRKDNNSILDFLNRLFRPTDFSTKPLSQSGGAQDIGISNVYGAQTTVVPDISAKLSLQIDNRMQLVVDGRILADIIKPYLEQSLVAFSNSAATKVTKNGTFSI